ncbi:auto-inhibited Ca2 -transporting ATPase 10 [Dorcoceras hygrometricum]|uniref:P-type Ca(2+) transporter n=1 Tax=Dorcoceras hygrometricum TaxID=472368 RepID=A0A2Z7B811_9LAMI|nr:auto-inhibited Ca2 -transporting ATPase 10 [Dorcoceras hygrometricum]
MVTGDNLQTAKAIALECAILGSNEDVFEPNIIEGKDFRNLTETQRLEMADKISVMARSSPNDKLLLVQALRKRGHVVAVTGDGTNDAPALHEACFFNIGLAMGVQGTEVAKESSDIIILDDNFASVVKVVRWGRSVYANIQKFIQFQLTVNVAALTINVVAAVSSGNVPLNAVQLLWVNLIMDTLGALALATEAPTDHLMHMKPVGRREPLITNIMWRNLLIQALYQVTVLLVLNFRGRSILNLEHETNDHAFKVKNTLIFNAFVLCQIFNEFNARKPDEMNVWSGLTKNHLFMGIIALEVVLQVIIIFYLEKFASTVRLSWKLWLVSIGIGFVSWPLAILGKLIRVPDKHFHEYFKIKSDQQRTPSGGTRLLFIH